MVAAVSVRGSLERCGEGGQELAGALGGGDQLVAALADGHDPHRQVGDAGVGEGAQTLLDGALAPGKRVWLVGLAETTTFRTNVGAVNLSSSAASVRFKFRKGADGELLGSTLLELAPFGQGQVNRGLAAAGVTGTSDVYAEVVLESGTSVLPWASVIDNRTGDPIFVPAAQ